MHELTSEKLRDALIIRRNEIVADFIQKPVKFVTDNFTEVQISQGYLQIMRILYKQDLPNNPLAQRTDEKQ